MNKTPRQFRRVLFSVPFTVRHGGAEGGRVSRGMTLDISEGGLGAMLQSIASVGDTVRIDLAVHDHAIKATAVVRHTSSGRSGFEFLELSEDDRKSIAALTRKSPKPS